MFIDDSHPTHFLVKLLLETGQTLKGADIEPNTTRRGGKREGQRERERERGDFLKCYSITSLTYSSISYKRKYSIDLY